MRKVALPRIPLRILVALLLLAASSPWGRAEELSGFYPSLIDTATGEPVDLSAFTSAEQCGECHTHQYRAWSSSMHAFAFRDPLYRAVLAEASKETGGKVDRLCVGCHTPIGTVAEFVWVQDDGSVTVDPLAEQGVTCDLCHSVQEVFLLEQGQPTGNAGLLLDPGGPKRGPHRDAVSDFHETQPSPLHSRSEICGACHNVFHPVSNTRIARTYQEWRESVYAENDIQCQDCHMVPPVLVPQVAATLKKPTLPGATSVFETFRSPFYPHTFSGANVPIPRLLGAEEHAQQAELLLQLAASLRIDYVRHDADDKTLELDVVVKNERAGHNLPTSMSEMRQMWLHVNVRDDSPESNLIWESGALDAYGTLDPEAQRFGANAVDESGNPTWKPWKIARIVSDTSIPPKRAKRVRYRIPVGDAPGPFRIWARLRYRSFSQEMADKYLKIEGYRVPVVTMASDRIVVGGE